MLAQIAVAIMDPDHAWEAESLLLRVPSTPMAFAKRFGANAE
jgi:hypothetical protein